MTTMPVRADLLRALLSGDAERLATCSLEEALQEKILPQVLGSRSDPASRAAAVRESHRREVLERELVTLCDTLLPLGVDFVLLRGLAVARHYADPRTRQFGDLDVLVRHVGDLPPILSALNAVGHRVVRPVILRGGARGARPWAGVALNKNVRDLDHPVYVDITTSGPAVTALSHVALPDRVWERRECLVVGDSSVPVLAATDLVVVFAVELCERAVCVVRDGLDLARLARLPIDQGEVRRCLEAAQAGGGLARLRPLLAAAGQPELVRFLDGLAPGPASRRWSLRVTANEMARVFGQRCPHLALRLARSASLTRLAAFAGLPVFLLPSKTPLPGLSGAKLLGGMSGYVARWRPLADEQEIAVCFGDAAATTADADRDDG